MTHTTLPLSELTTTTIQLLCREIGVVNTIRFLQQFTTGFGNYTEERDQWLGHLTVDEIVAEIKHKQAGRKASNAALSTIPTPVNFPAG